MGRTRFRILLLPLFIGVSVALVAVGLWVLLATEERAQLGRTVEAEAFGLAGEVVEVIQPRVASLQRMARQWERRGGMPDDEWRGYAADLMETQRGYQAIELVDADLRVRQVVPLAGNEQVQGLDLGFEPRRRRGLVEARETREPQVTRAVDLVQGGRGILIQVPLFLEDRFGGYIVGVFRLDRLLGPTLADVMSRGYDVALLEGADVIAGMPDRTDPRWTRTLRFVLPNGPVWRALVTPSPALLAELRSPVPGLTLGVGLVMAILLAFTVHFFRDARSKTVDLQAAYGELEEENRERRRVQAALTTLTETLEERVAERGRELDASRAAAVELERQLLQSQKIEAVGRLAGGIAHDFNNMLMAISGFGDVATTRLPPDHAARRPLEQLLRAADQAAELTGQILAFSRKQVLQPRVVRLSELLEGTEQILRRLIGEHIELVLVTGPDEDWVCVDPGPVQQAIVNLAINARDAMEDGGRLTFGISRATRLAPTDDPEQVAPRDWLLLEVTDTGHGMDEATAARVFEPFFTTKALGKGSGLGLAMVHGVVTQSGGFVEVASAPGAGTTFRVFLPAQEAAEAAAEPAPEAAPAPAPPVAQTVLLAEDEPMVREMTVEVLEAAGYAVLAAGDGEEALALVRRHPGPIHALLTDVRMPRMGGRELSERAVGLRPGLPVVFMSGYTASELGMDNLLAADVRFLRKPVRPRELVAAVREAVEAAGGAARDGGSPAA